MSEAFEKFDLPSGGWVAFRDPKMLTRRQRKPIDRASTRIGVAGNVHATLRGDASAAALSDDDLDLFEGLMNACALVLISEWSFSGEPTLDSLEDLRDDDYKAIIEAAQKHRDVLIPDFTPTAEQTDEDGKPRPIGSSEESKSTSGDNPQISGFPSLRSELGDS